MTKRKTITVETVKAKANHVLASDVMGDDASDRGFRRGVASMLEMVLFETDNYRGFNYLDSEFAGKVSDGSIHLRDGYDDTRRRYY